jgi:5,5'-dehydrodivanillate O-demethylase
LLREQCSHRGASLCYGRIELNGLRCPYHGWLYDAEGACLEQPAEPAGSTYKDLIQHPAYPLQEAAGLLFGYLGPRPAPLLPQFDVIARQDWIRRVEIHPPLDCNWFQPMENAVDPAHTYWLHGYTGGSALSQPDEDISFEPFDFGIYKRHHRGSRYEVHPLVFPNMLRGPGNVAHFRIPMDDTHTRIIYILFTASADGSPSGQTEVPYQYIGPIKGLYDDQGYPRYRHHMLTFASQDGMAWETQGPISNRTQEHLGTTDRGIVLLRNMLRLNIEKVQRGEDPLGVIRDPEENEVINFIVGSFDAETGEPIPERGLDEGRTFALVEGRSWQQRRAAKPIAVST